MEENKKLIVIIGPNGVGKSTTAKSFMFYYSKSAFADSDWCRAINPFPFTQETKKTVTDNTFYYYDGFDYPAIDTSELQTRQVVERIAEIVGISGDFRSCMGKE